MFSFPSFTNFRLFISTTQGKTKIHIKHEGSDEHQITFPTVFMTIVVGRSVVFYVFLQPYYYLSKVIDDLIEIISIQS